MKFLNPGFLWALLTLAIPIIIHLFNFRKYRTVYFSNVSFLKDLKNETRHRSKIKNLLILLLRLLALASLVLLFARPYIPFNESEKVIKTNYVAVWVDNSFSMEAEGNSGALIEEAKLKAESITRYFPENTRYMLITNNFELKHNRFVDKDKFAEWVSQIHSTHIFRTVEQVLQRAGNIKPEDNAIVHLFLFSDFQKNIIRKESLDVPSDIKLTVMPLENELKSNLLIDTLWFESPGHYKGKEERVHVRVRNISGDVFNSIPVRLIIDDTLVSTVNFSIEAGKTEEVVLPFVKYSPRCYNAYAELTDYPITFDNRMYFSFKIEAKKRVLLITDGENEKYYSALFVKDENIELQKTSFNNIHYAELQNYSLVIVDSPLKMATGLSGELFNYVLDGGAVLFIPALSPDINSYNHFTQSLAKISWGNFVKQKGTFDKVDFKYRMLNDVFVKTEKKMRLPEYNGFFVLKNYGKSSIHTVCKTESGYPLFVEVNRGRGSIYISALPLNKDITDFATHSLFVPLMYNIALFSSSYNSLYFNIEPNMVNSFPVVKVNNNVRLINTETGVELSPKFVIVNHFIKVFPDASLLSNGYYQLKAGEKILDCLSYNYNRKESDVSYFTKSELKEIFKDKEQVSIISAGSKNGLSKIVSATQGKPLGQLFLIFAIVAVVLEMIVLSIKKL